MTLIDTKVYRVFFGVLLTVFCFAFVWETLKTGKMPAVPVPTGATLCAMTGAEPMLAFINGFFNRPKQ